MTRTRAALAAGVAVALLVTAAALSAWDAAGGARATAGGDAEGTAWSFALALAAAFVAYLLGLAALRRAGPRLAAVVAIAVVVQLAPLGAPLLLSTDAWTYWAYGWTAAEGGGNPYVDAPLSFPESPALPWMGSAWRDTTSVYGPAFTLASEPLALAAGGSEDATAWLYKTLAAVAALAAALLASRVATRRAFALAFVGWNPVLAVHAAGGGHNDAWVGALAVAALALAASRRSQAAGVAWSLAVLLKWVPALFLVLHALALRARRERLPVLGLAAATAVVLALATARYGLHWLSALVPLAENAARETSYALPARLESAGVPRGVALGLAGALLAVGGAWLVRSALRGRARTGLAACLLLATTPYLAVWYLAWALPLAAADEDGVAAVACLALTAYLLPQTIPL